MTAGTAVWTSGVLVGIGVAVGWRVLVAVGNSVAVAVAVGDVVAVGTAVGVVVGDAVAVAVGKTMVGVMVGALGNGRLGPQPSNNSKINSPHRLLMAPF